MPKKLQVVVRIDDKDIDANDRRDAITLAEHAIKSGKTAIILVNGTEDKELNSKLSSVFESVSSSVIVGLRIASSDLTELSKKANSLAVPDVLAGIDELQATLRNMYDMLDKHIGEKTDDIAFSTAT